MQILNTTFYIKPGLRDGFLNWMRKYVKALPAEIAHELDEVELPLTESETGDTLAFALRLSCNHRNILADWHDSTGAELRDTLGRMYGQDTLHFSTFMQKIQL